MRPEKSSLSIRLAEPVVPLRGTPDRVFHHQDGEILPPAVVRGVLTLKLAKPTKVSSIRLELQAKATTHYQDHGPSRIDITEQYKVHSASTVVFQAGHTPAQHARFSGVEGRHWQAPLVPHSMSLRASLEHYPRSLRARQPRSGDLEIDDGSSPQQSQVLLDSAPPYSSQAGQNSFLSGDFLLPMAGRSSSVASSSRITGPQSSPAPSRSNLTPDTLYGLPTTSETPMRDLVHTHTSGITEDENESTGTCALHRDNVVYYGLSHVAVGSSGGNSEQDQRGRSHSRFSFGRIVHALDMVKDHVRSLSPRSYEQEQRGRSLAKGKRKAYVSTYGVKSVLLPIGISKPSVTYDVKDQSGDGWIAFPEGTYTYPIFFTISHKSPPTMKADHGSLIWKVKAEVKRPNTFKPSMIAQKEVIVVCLLKDDDSEEEEGIDLQKQWENQLQYRVQVTGHGFPVGGKMPFQLTIAPLAKIKVHCISVYLEERTKYYTRAESQVRSDAIRPAKLLVIRHEGFRERYTEPVLPLVSDGPDAFRASPLYRFLNPGEDESEVASSFMGPGPWTISHQLRMPNSCSILHPSNQSKGSNVMVDHRLKVTLRVEREEETRTAGRKKLYDIVMHIPIQILSCHCTSEWTSLPRYDKALRSEDDSPEDMLACPCRTRAAQMKAQPAQVQLLEHITSPPTTCSNPLEGIFPPDSLINCTHLHEQLMSGLMSERGEAPPPYDTRSLSLFG